MNRRDFTQSTLLTLLSAAGLSACSGSAKEYTTLAKAAPTSAKDGRIEVLEFFNYGCVHCYEFEKEFNAWKSKKEAHLSLLDIKQVHIAFDRSSAIWQVTYYAIESMGIKDKVHRKLFEAIHMDKFAPTHPNEVIEWMAKQGINKEEFIKHFQSRAVFENANKANTLTAAYEVTGTPSFGVNGKYYVEHQGSKTLDVIDKLTEQADK